MGDEIENFSECEERAPELSEPGKKRESLNQEIEIVIQLCVIEYLEGECWE